MLLQLVFGVSLGVIAAVRRNTWSDSAARLVALVAQSAPTFFVGPLLIYLFAYKLGWFPIGGYGDTFVERLHHLVLPALTLATLGTAVYTRLVRSDMIDALNEDYVRTARAKGLPGSTVVWHHALRNALLPLVTLVGLDLGVLLGGAIVTEQIFQWPGMGREAVLGILSLDLPVVLGVVLVAACAIVIANLIVDLLYAWLDPRVRLQ
jgi:peptide/nickel transport system permease protein